jgi:hypothetical protein
MTHSSPVTEFDRSVDEAAERLVRDFERYCATDNADPDAYIDRIEYLLEELDPVSGRDALAAASYRAFLERVISTEEGPV